MYQDRLSEPPSEGRPVYRNHSEGREDQLRVRFIALQETNSSTIVPLQLWDTPANYDLDQLDVPLSSFSTLVYVMDMQVRTGTNHKQPLIVQQDDSYHEAVRQAVTTIVRGYLANQSMKFSVFIHKAEALSEDYRGGEQSVPISSH